MALQDMIAYIQEETKKEVDDHKNQVNMEETKKLIARGEELERHHEEEIYQYKSQLKKREETLKAEQDFIFSTQELTAESQFTDELFVLLNQELLHYIEEHKDVYERTLEIWLAKVQEALGVIQMILKAREQDLEIIKKYSKALDMDIALESAPHITAGFLIQAEGGVFVDLTFKTLFQEQKDQLLAVSMQMIKEKS